MKFFKNMIRWALLPVIMMSALIVFTACGGGSPKPKTKTYNINFIVDDEIYETIKTSGKDEITLPENPEKEEYVFDGWFYDLDVWEEPFLENSLIEKNLTSDLNVYAKWKEIVLDRIEYNHKTNVSIHDSFDAKLFDAVCKDKDGVILPIPITVTTAQEVEAGQKIKINLTANYKEKKVEESLTVNVYGDPVLECDESKDFIVYPKHDGIDWLKISAKDSFGLDLKINLEYDKALKHGEVVNLTVSVQDDAGNTISKNIEGLKVYEYLEIRTADDLKNVDMELDYKLMNDIDLMWANWTPLAPEEANPYTGVFDGCNHTIKNFNINAAFEYLGLFGYNAGTIKNLAVKNFSINYDHTATFSPKIGGLVGGSEGNILDCSATGDIHINFTENNTKAVTVGGLVGLTSLGLLDPKVVRCSANVNITTTDSDFNTTRSVITVGGLVGYTFPALIIDCNSSSVLNINAYHISAAGGFAGEIYDCNSIGDIENCYSTGNVECREDRSDSHIGGFCGLINEVKLYNCYATGNVKYTTTNEYADSYIGGFCGYADSFVIKKCFSTGNIEGSGGSQNIGGMIGEATGYSSMGYCYSTGDISNSSTKGTSCSGGLIGSDRHSEVYNCYAEGSVHVSSVAAYSGGLIGLSKYTNVSYCYTLSFVSAVTKNSYGWAYAGGLVGDAQYSTFTNCFTAGRGAYANENEKDVVSTKVYAGNIYAVQTKITITKCYIVSGFELTATRVGKGQNVKVDDGETDSRSASYFQSEDFVAGSLNFDKNVWVFADGSYPKLKSVRTLEKSSDIVIEISTKEDILEFQYSSAHINYVLTNDIDLEGSAFSSYMFGNIYGEFDGRGHTIKNFVMGVLTASKKTYVPGIFGTNYGTIKNLNFSDFEMYSTCSVFGCENYGIIENCNVKVNYCEDSSAGFVQSNIYGTIRNCSAAILLGGDSNTGGFVFLNSKGTIENCYCDYYNEIDVDSGTSARGGFVLFNSGKILNCYTKCDFNIDCDFNPFLGSNNGTQVYYDKALKSFLSGLKIGGFVYFNSGEIENCFALGNVLLDGYACSVLNEEYSKTEIVFGEQIGIGSFVYTDCGTITNCYRQLDQEATFRISYWDRAQFLRSLDVDVSSFLKNYCFNLNAANLEDFMNEKFVTENLNWDASDWNFVEGELPTLKNNQLS